MTAHTNSNLGAGSEGCKLKQNHIPTSSSDVTAEVLLWSADSHRQSRGNEDAVLELVLVSGRRAGQGFKSFRTGHKPTLAMSDHSTETRQTV